MEKLYFTKYLPVAGEIKVGEEFYYIDPEPNYIGNWSGKSKVIEFINNNLIHIEIKGTTTSCSKKELYKLFLCSRDIQVGDKVLDSTGTLKATLEIQPQPNEIASGKYIKVIGEISPDATWVKEGDEFNEDDWRVYNHVIGMVVKKYSKGEYSDPIKYCIEIKGPCGHFH